MISITVAGKNIGLAEEWDFADDLTYIYYRFESTEFPNAEVVCVDYQRGVIEYPNEEGIVVETHRIFK